MTDIWHIFPYPTMTADEFANGSIVEAHPDCLECSTRECLDDLRAPVGETAVCRYGISYARVDEVRVLNGVVAIDPITLTNRAKRRIRDEKERRVTSGSIGRAVGHARELGAGAVVDYQLHKE